MKRLENFQKTIGWCLEKSQELQWSIVKYKYGNDQAASGMNLYME